MNAKFIVPLGAVLILSLAGLVAGCGGSGSNTSPPSTNAAANNPVAQPEIFAQKKVDVSALNQALQQYNAAEGHYPKDLKELAPSYIGKVPEAPNGYKFNYDPNAGTVTMVQQ